MVGAIAGIAVMTDGQSETAYHYRSTEPTSCDDDKTADPDLDVT